MEGFKYIKNINEGVGEIRIYEPIGISINNGKEVGISGSQFANEMAYLKTMCNKINIRINSDGGSVIDGYAIFSSIINAGVETESFIDGVAASTAGWCAMAAGRCSIMDYATLMIHGASGSDDKELISLINSSIAKMISNRSGMSDEESNKMMKTETWLSAVKDKDILLSKKFVDEIISTGKKVKVKNADRGNLSAIYNSIINPKKNMSKINTLLKLRNDAEESEQEQAVASLTKELTEAKSEVEQLQSKLKAIEEEAAKKAEEAQEALNAKATALVNQAHKDGKLTADEVAMTIANASKDEANFAFISNMISKLGAGKESKKPFDFKNVAGKEGSNDRSDWNFTKWSKEDPSGLLKLQNESPEQFTDLYNKEFKK